MEFIGSVTNAVLLLLVGGLLSWQLNGRFKALDGRIDTVEARIDTVQRSVQASIDTVQRSVDGLRSDLTQIALVVGTKRESGAGA